MITPDEMKAEIRHIARGISVCNNDTVWVSTIATAFDALSDLYTKLDGGDLQYAIDLEDELEIERKAREAKLIL